MSGPAWSDADLLRMLALDADGYTSAQIAARLGRETGRGCTRNAIVGALHRIKGETRGQACAATRPENRDGGMPADWWVPGLRAQEVRQ